jgi:hypothetical protein
MKRKTTILSAILVFAAAAAISMYSCSSGGSSDSSTPATGTAQAAVTMKADFTVAGAPQLKQFKMAAPHLTTCPGTTAAMDGPEYVAGLDCDGDGGFTAFLTPATFKVAIKRLSFMKSGGSVDVVPDSGTLAQSTVFDITSQITISQLTLTEGLYTAVEAEIYYYEITMPLNSSPTVTQTIRVYLSDDDFPAEGNHGHHQGDITLIDQNGIELGWVGVATPWTLAYLQTDPALVTRPGGTDAQTGHQRGLFGNDDLWNQTAFDQGSSRDVFLISVPLGLTLTANLSKTVSFTFNVMDSWFWEDFDNDGNFNPCETPNAHDACASYAEWAPIFNLPVLSVQ